MGVVIADGVDLTQVGAPGESMQQRAEVEGGRVLGDGDLAAWRGQRGGGRWLLGGERVEQRLDLTVAFGDLAPGGTGKPPSSAARRTGAPRDSCRSAQPPVPDARRGSGVAMEREPLGVAFSGQDAAQDP